MYLGLLCEDGKEVKRRFVWCITEVELLFLALAAWLRTARNQNFSRHICMDGNELRVLACITANSTGGDWGVAWFRDFSVVDQTERGRKYCASDILTCLGIGGESTRWPQLDFTRSGYGDHHQNLGFSENDSVLIKRFGGENKLRRYFRNLQRLVCCIWYDFEASKSCVRTVLSMKKLPFRCRITEGFRRMFELSESSSACS